MCDKNKGKNKKCIDDSFNVSAPIDRPTCLEQASLAYSMYEEEASKGNTDTAALWMGIAHLLFHLEDGSYTLTQTLSKPNMGVY
jgi:hypothetical protein